MRRTGRSTPLLEYDQAGKPGDISDPAKHVYDIGSSELTSRRRKTYTTTTNTEMGRKKAIMLSDMVGI